MAGEAQSPETPDTIPFVSPETVALAERIDRAIRVWFVFMGEAERDAQLGADMEAIADERSYRMSLGEKRPAAARSTRIHWLAGVLAGAMGGQAEPKGDQE
jgi:hypothetical protein